MTTVSSGPAGVPLKAQGKTFVFTGKLPHWYGNATSKLVEAEGGSVASAVAANVDYLIEGPGRTGTSAAGKKAAKFNQGGASIQILDEAGFEALFLPTRDEATALLRGGPAGVERWQHLVGSWWWAASQIDLCGADLSSARLSSVNLRPLKLDDANLQGADLSGCQLPALVRVQAQNSNLHSNTLIGPTSECKFDGANLGQVRLTGDFTDCSFQKIDGGECCFNPVKLLRVDFTEAKLSKAAFSHAQGDGVVFRQADLTDAHLGGCKLQAPDFSAAKLTRIIGTRSDFAGGNFRGADLQQADLAECKLLQADLRDANLQNANLRDADLTGAQVDGADFTGATLSGCKVDAVDFSKAKGYDPNSIQAQAAGSNLQELERVAKKARRLQFNVTVDTAGGPVQLHGTTGYNANWISLQEHTGQQQNYPSAKSLSNGLLDFASKWPGGKPQIDSIEGRITGGSIASKDLKKLLIAVWHEVFGLPVPTDQELKDREKSQRSAQEKLRDQYVAELKSGAAGVKAWNNRAREDRTATTYRKVDLSGAALAGLKCPSIDFEGTNFSGADLHKATFAGCARRGTNFQKADLRNADLRNSRFASADFSDAQLAGANLRTAKFTKALFVNADLQKADLSYADLSGADLTGAKLDGVEYLQTKYDLKTRWPSGYRLPAGLEGHGVAHALPEVIAEPEAPKEEMDFATLLQKVRAMFDASRVGNALQMLKKDRFQLFSHVEKTLVDGVVRSQSSGGLVYSCILTADGNFHCCTQNLNICGALRGMVCKHLLVLVLGLCSKGAFSPALANQWLEASKKRRPVIDRERASEIFLKYKGVEAGEIDWRPTETIPEDFYAL